MGNYILNYVFSLKKYKYIGETAGISKKTCKFAVYYVIVGDDAG